MNIVFAGTPEFAAAALDAILAAAPSAGWTVPLVLTQPDRPAGRGMKVVSSAVKNLAVTHGIEVASPLSLRSGNDATVALARLKAAEPDVLVVAAYGLIVPQSILDIPHGLRAGEQPKLRAINIHASLLPRWRGAAPIVRAIEAGDRETGITLMQMDAGLDTGPTLTAEKVAIEPTDTAGTLTARLAQLGAHMIVDALRDPDRLSPTPQSGPSTYADKVGKAEAWINWSSAADVLQRQVRAFDPYPVATTALNGVTVRLWRAQSLAGPDRSSEPGVVRSADATGVRVSCGAGELLLTELQRAGGKRLPARDFVAGFAVKPGDRFLTPSALPQ